MGARTSRFKSVTKSVSRSGRVLVVLVLQSVALLWGAAPTLAAFEGCLVDSRAEAMGDCWCVSSFSALSLAPLPPPGTGFALGFSYRRPFGLRELDEKDIVVNVPLSRCLGSLGLIERGGSLYRERMLSVTMSVPVPRAAPRRASRAAAPNQARTALGESGAQGSAARKGQAQRPEPGQARTALGRQAGTPAASSVSVSLSLTAFEISVDGWGRTRYVSVSAGARAAPVSFADACVGLGNIVSSDNDAALRQTFLFGIVVKPFPQARLAFEVRRNPGVTSSFHVGAELEPASGTYIRCGLRTEPLELMMGFGFGLSGFGLDTASSFHPVLGRTDSFSLSVGR